MAGVHIEVLAAVEVVVMFGVLLQYLNLPFGVFAVQEESKFAVHVAGAVPLASGSTFYCMVEKASLMNQQPICQV